MSSITPGIRIRLRGEDFLVTNSERDIIDVDGISELVHGQRFQFDLRLEDYDIIQPESTNLQVDLSPGYRQTKLFLETVFRNSSHYSENIEIAHKTAIRGADYQYEPTLKALKLPQPRILIADAVGLGKTVQVGIFLAELIRRGKGKKILVVTPKSILAQFQQEIWSRFAIPLVRLDSQGIARIKEEIPSNKNPFDYYDKVIVSVDTLKNNGKFRHFLERVHWDIVAIDECHNVANIKSQRGRLARDLASQTDALVLTSATPHNGKKENFANLLSLLDPTSVTYNGDFDPEGIKSLFVRRFKKDIKDEVGDAFKDRITKQITCELDISEEAILSIIQDYKKEAYKDSQGDLSNGSLLFSIGLFKGYMSSPSACLETVKKRLHKNVDDNNVLSLLNELKGLLEEVISTKVDSKYKALVTSLNDMKWSGAKNAERVIIFSERRETLNFLERNLRNDFDLNADSIVQFNGSLTDSKQQEILEDFSKEDSKIRLFLASDAGSQGVNLHYHCHHMFNYDIPWSIITLDQRNGRIDRYGQKETPMIYYLISESGSNDVQGDIRILEKLKEKEEEVYKSLGDAGRALGLFDSSVEELSVTRAIASSDLSSLESQVNNADVSWMDDVFGGLDESDSTATETAGVVKDEGFKSFYKDDFNYYLTLTDELISYDDDLKGRFLADKEDKIIEIEKTDELSNKGVLYDVPREVFHSKVDTYKLTTDANIVEQAIVQARKKQKQWPTHQLLYDLNPIAKWMQNKLLAQVDRGNALLVKMRSPLPENSAWFVFQGITSNGQGKPILSKTFVVGKSFDSDALGSLEDFADFMTQYRLVDSLPTLETSNDEKASVQALLKGAVDSAKKLYDFKLKGDLEDELEEKLEHYQQRLNNWLVSTETQLEMQFGEDTAGSGSFYKKKRRRDVNYVKENMERFYTEFFQLENEPYMRLLAVFFNKK